jgi:dTDP-4-dehydrorhamnose reductase
MKVLVTGASGFVGRHLTSALAASGVNVFSVFKSNAICNSESGYCDLIDYDSVKLLLERIQPDTIIHCAAISNVEECQRNMLTTWENNVGSTLNLIKSIKPHIHFVFLSTDQIYDGREGEYSENSIRNPKNWYGHTKVACEDLVSHLVLFHTIIRLSFQYGYDVKRRNFIHLALEKLLSDETVSASDDLVSSPTYIDTTIGAIQEIIENRIRGSFNIADIGCISKYQLIYKLAKSLGKSSKVLKEKSDTIFLAKRPKNSSLNVTKFLREFSTNPMNIDDALSKFYADFKRQQSAPICSNFE